MGERTDNRTIFGISEREEFLQVALSVVPPLHLSSQINLGVLRCIQEELSSEQQPQAHRQL
jgi:hypothetical protein